MTDMIICKRAYINSHLDILASTAPTPSLSSSVKLLSNKAYSRTIAELTTLMSLMFEAIARDEATAARRLLYLFFLDLKIENELLFLRRSP